MRLEQRRQRAMWAVYHEIGHGALSRDRALAGLTVVRSSGGVLPDLTVDWGSLSCFPYCHSIAISVAFSLLSLLVNWLLLHQTFENLGVWVAINLSN